MKYATDIAYLDLGLLNDYKLLDIEGSVSENTDSYHTVGELLDIRADGPDEYTQEYFDGLVEGKDTFGDELVSLDASKINGLPEEALDWKIVETFDENKPGESGFYGTVIDTGDGLIVSFRGSEPVGDLQNLQQDWIKADAGLIIGDVTEQQQDANRFIDYLINKGYFNGEQDIYFAGHSLGGNLAEHSTFYAASRGVSEHIIKTMSYDGPGFTKEYLREHREAIKTATENVEMKHIEQSLVGGLLQYVPGVEYMYAKLNDNGAVLHGTEYVVFDKDGNVVKGHTATQLSTSLSTFLVSPLSEGLDDLISPAAGKVIVNTLIHLTTFGSNAKDWLTNKWGSLSTEGKMLITSLGAGLATIAIKLAPPVLIAATLGLAKFALAAVAVVGLVILAAYVLEVLEDIANYIVFTIIPAVVNWIVDGVSKFVDWAAEELRDFGNFLADAASGLWDGLVGLFDRGNKAYATPYIKVDTYKLKTYASRLESVKARIRSVDSDLNMLYLTEGFLDILQLMIAEKLPTTRQMNKVINYLEETAQAFESAENKIMNM